MERKPGSLSRGDHNEHMRQQEDTVCWSRTNQKWEKSCSGYILAHKLSIRCNLLPSLGGLHKHLSVVRPLQMLFGIVTGNLFHHNMS